MPQFIKFWFDRKINADGQRYAVIYNCDHDAHMWGWSDHWSGISEAKAAELDY